MNLNYLVSDFVLVSVASMSLFDLKGLIYQKFWLMPKRKNL